MTLTIRPATPEDVELVRAFVVALAIYERLEHEVEATAADFARELFSHAPRVFCEIADFNGEPAGFALWYYTFSTFQGRHGIWLEDLFVHPHLRGHGVGKALLKRLAMRCVKEGLGRFEWAVLDWNQPSIEFYQRQGAVIMHDWQRCRVTGPALEALAV